MAAEITERKPAEANDKRSDVRYRLLHEGMRDAFVQMDMQGRILDCNEIFCQLVGYARAELAGSTIAELTPARWRKDDAFILETQVLVRGYSDLYEKEYQRKDGRLVPIELQTILVGGAGDEPQSMFATIRDISERKAHEQERAREVDVLRRLLQLSELSSRDNNLQHLLEEVIETAIAVTGADFGNVQLVDHATGDLHIVAHRGFSKTWIGYWERVGKGRGACGTALERGERTLVEDVMESPIFRGTPALQVQLDAKVRAVQSTPLVGWTGKRLGMFSTHHSRPHKWDERTLKLLDLLARQTSDIIERKQADEKLRAAYDSFRHLVDRSPFGVYAVDADFKLVQASVGAMKVFENVEPLMGRDFAEVLRTIWMEPFASEVIAHFRHTLKTGQPYRQQGSFERRADTAEDEAYDWMIERMMLPDGRPGVVCHFYDLSERQRHEEHIRLLMREVNHRSKNMLSLIQVIARRTAAKSPGDFLQRFEERVGALAAAQDLLVKNSWKAVPLADLVRTYLGYFADLIGTRILCKGPPVSLTASAAQAIGMALHELATNAAKYGALSNETGRVELSWDLDSAVDPQAFSMCWKESGGPRVSPPTRSGFGSSVVTTALATSIGGEVSHTHPPGGVRWSMTCTAASVLEDGVTRARPENPDAQRRVPGAQRVLIVEDEAILASDMASELADAGFEVVGPAGTASYALDLIKARGCDTAILDVTLRNETSEPVAQWLLGHGIPFVVVSGYSTDQLPAALTTARQLTKPVSRAALLRELRRCLDASRPAYPG